MAEHNGVNMKGKNIKWWAFLFAPSIFLILVIGIPFIYVVINFFSLNEISSFFEFNLLLPVIHNIPSEVTIIDVATP